ncbi:MAG TPA: GNAT family N-acetyltransferase [Verrucomicrobiae bacterium]|nr:GNAT family N-acetyltransferase [Verrucomicrobiae bacterium]
MTGLLADERQKEQQFKETFLNGDGAGQTNGSVVRTDTDGIIPINGNGESYANGRPTCETDENVIIRHYKPEDRASVRRICCDTGFLGRPIETIFNDREIFADLFTNPYLNYGAEWAWVAEDSGRIVGYLLGAVSSTFNYTLMYSGFQTTVKMIKRAATGCYASHPRSRHFIRWLLTHGFREQPKHPDNAAHLHLNVEKSHRGHGLGLRLWHAFEHQLEHAGVRNCYGAFFSRPRRRPEVVYSRLGFSVFDRKATTIVQPEVTEPIEVVCVHRKLE